MGAVPDQCWQCGGPNVEENDPEPGLHTCRDCGYVHDEED